MVRVYSSERAKGGKIEAPAYSVSGKGPSLCLNDFLGDLTKPAFTQSARHITSPFKKHVIFTISRNSPVGCCSYPIPNIHHSKNVTF